MFIAEQTLKQGRGRIAEQILKPGRENACSLANLESGRRREGS